MYNDYFGFTDSPFENNLDQRFLFFSANHKEVSAALLYFIKMKKGFALVCGDVGTGKTMLINYLLNKLPDTVHPIMIMNPDVGYIEILRYVAGILKIDAKGKRVLDLVDHVKAALVEASRQGKRFVLIIDEAHLLSDRSIEQIRLLSNIETQEYKLFQILLLGQYELSYKLNRPELRQLRQRININRFLAPMDAAETIQYIDHRLRMAGSGFNACFESNCRHLIYKMTNGVPRSINQLCDSALLACMAEKRKKVTRKILKTAGTVLRSDVLFTPRTIVRGSRLSWRVMTPWIASGVALIVASLWLTGYRGGLGEKAQRFLHGIYPPMQQLAPSTPTPVEPLPALIPAAPLEVPKAERQLSKPQALENKALSTDSGSVSSETQPLPHHTEVKASPPEVAGNIDQSSPSAGKDIQSEKQPPVPKEPIIVVVKEGDTLMGIASRFFPNDKAEGVKKILAVNPMIDNRNRILKGQELIIPLADFNREAPN
jgi:general secretion pathway protein A